MEIYYESVEKTKDINMALARTKINSELVEKIFQERGYEENYTHYLRAILWNYIINAYQRIYDIDLYPDSVGGMYGYCVEILSGNKDKKRNGTLTSDSLRFDLERKELTVSDIYIKNKDIFLTIIGSMNFFEEEIVSKLEKGKFKYGYRYIYENVYQVLTAALCMEKIDFFINGIEYECDFPLKMKREEYYNYITIRGKGLTYYINKNTGELIFKNNVKIKYKDWCNGKIDDGIKFLSKIGEEKEIPLFFSFSIGGFGGPSYSVNINFIKNECVYNSYKAGLEEGKEEIIKLNKAGMNMLRCKISIYIREWKSEYRSKEIILDGTSWSMEYTKTDKMVRSSGSNAYPENFSGFCREIRNIIGKEFS